MEQFLTDLVTKFPMAAGILSVLMVIRLINKPTFSILRSIAEATESPRDNEILDNVEKSAIYKGTVYVLDWLFSIKLKK